MAKPPKKTFRKPTDRTTPTDPPWWGWLLALIQTFICIKIITL